MTLCVYTKNVQDLMDFKDYYYPLYTYFYASCQSEKLIFTPVDMKIDVQLNTSFNIDATVFH